MTSSQIKPMTGRKGFIRSLDICFTVIGLHTFLFFHSFYFSSPLLRNFFRSDLSVPSFFLYSSFFSFIRPSLLSILLNFFYNSSHPAKGTDGRRIRCPPSSLFHRVHEDLHLVIPLEAEPRYPPSPYSPTPDAGCSFVSLLTREMTWSSEGAHRLFRRHLTFSRRLAGIDSIKREMKVPATTSFFCVD
ncbi:unnamed protein product [Cuscuta epithymum]|uniref:Transmembrane protein n=1 Tax=Cuscuta epithymum TaxID=186058 RepID=A0AAV0ENE7_9ASTE|nr:unnamed protein product [Cuscuta epithymum]